MKSPRLVSYRIKAAQTQSVQLAVGLWTLQMMAWTERLGCKPSGDTHYLVRLEAQAPGGIGEAIGDGGLKVLDSIRAIHRLQEEAIKP
jgi:hypothetical protein